MSESASLQNGNPFGENKGKYIGSRKISEVKETNEKTPSGLSIFSVEYEDQTVEWISSIMLKEVVSDSPCDLTELREKRVVPIIQVILTILRDWGIKLSELPYLSILLTQSLEFNHKEALLELWGKWMPKPLSPEDVDMLTIDKVLHSIKKLTIEDVLRKPPETTK